MTYHFELTEEQANLVLLALSQLPYHQVYPLIQALQAQAQRQREEVPHG